MVIPSCRAETEEREWIESPGTVLIRGRVLAIWVVVSAILLILFHLLVVVNDNLRAEYWVVLCWVLLALGVFPVLARLPVSSLIGVAGPAKKVLWLNPSGLTRVLAGASLLLALGVFVLAQVGPFDLSVPRMLFYMLPVVWLPQVAMLWLLAPVIPQTRTVHNHHREGTTTPVPQQAAKDQPVQGSRTSFIGQSARGEQTSLIVPENSRRNSVEDLGQTSDAEGPVPHPAPSVAEPATGTPLVKGQEGRHGVANRLGLLRELSRLTPADWATLVAVIPGAAPQVSRHGTVAEQVSELVRWAESPLGPGLASVEQTFEALRNS
jgi:hypothetical protein